MIGFAWGPIVIRSGAGAIFVRFGQVELLYETQMIPEIAVAVAGGLALLGCVWWWSMHRKG